MRDLHIPINRAVPTTHPNPNSPPRSVHPHSNSIPSSHPELGLANGKRQDLARLEVIIEEGLNCRDRSCDTSSPGPFSHSCRIDFRFRLFVIALGASVHFPTSLPHSRHAEFLIYPGSSFPPCANPQILLHLSSIDLLISLGSSSSLFASPSPSNRLLNPLACQDRRKY